MANFRDPVVVALDGFILSKFWHFMSGLFIWEFLTTLHFEWSVIRGRRRYRWTIWVYSLSRVAALGAVIADLIVLNLNTGTPVDCQLVVTLTWIFAYVAFAAASFLIVLRIVAIWNRSRVVVTTATIVWATNSASFIQGLSRLRYTREVPDGLCVALNIQVTQVTIIISFVTDMLLLAIMLVGLFRLGCHRHGAFATGRFLWNQGVILLLLVSVAGVLPTVFVFLNANAPLSLIFLVPWLITMSITATRMYRGLDDFFSSDVNYSPHVPGPPNNSGHTISISRSWGTPAVPIPLDGMGVDTHTAHRHSVTSQAIRDSLGGNTDKQLHDKPHELV